MQTLHVCPPLVQKLFADAFPILGAQLLHTGTQPLILFRQPFTTRRILGGVRATAAR
jgi:hypothetical protein